MRGVNIELAGATDNIGIDVTVPNGDTHFIARSPDSGPDFFKISVAAAGATTLTTNDNSGTAADLTLAVDGDIVLGPAGGDVLPDVDNTVNLGSPSARWANVYTGDLHLRNDQGNWTIQEDSDKLIVINNLTGKRYKMMLEPLGENE
jgi:hypothetical protein